MQTKSERRERFIEILNRITKTGLFTQKQIAKALNKGETYLSQIRSGKFPSETLVQALEQFEADRQFDKRLEDGPRDSRTNYKTALEQVLGEDLARFAHEAAGSLPGGAEEFVRDLVKAKRAESERLTDEQLSRLETAGLSGLIVKEAIKEEESPARKAQDG